MSWNLYITQFKNYLTLERALATNSIIKLSNDDRLLITIPYRFISSISHFLVCTISGASFLGVEKKLFIKDIINLMIKNKINAFGASPFHVNFIAKVGSKILPCLDFIMSSGDHLRSETINLIFIFFF